MKAVYRLIITIVFTMPFVWVLAQNSSKSEQHASVQNFVIKLDGSVQNNWTKSENDNSTTQNVQTTENESVSFSSSSDGIYITINKGSNKIKLFALTGQLLLNGDLSQGRFFIPTHRGIYFLKINNNSYKVVCK
jgi:hypothetical protein